MRYRYSGPNSAVTLKVSDGQGGLKDQDVVLWNGQEIDLPANHEWVATLLAKGHLSPVPVKETASTPKANKK